LFSLTLDRLDSPACAQQVSNSGLTGRSHAEYVAADSLVDMIKEDLVAERIAIDSYRELIQYLGHDDPTTTRMLKNVLAVEEEHAEELSDLLVGLPGQSGR